MKITKIISALLCLVMTALCYAGCSTATGKTGTPDEAGGFSIPEIENPFDTGEVSASWFDDAVFVGDSITLKFSYYCDEHPEALGKAQFLFAASLGYTNALWDINDKNAVHPYFKGTNHLTQECAKLTGAKKVFIMLGMNGVGLFGIDKTLEDADTLIGKILSETPDVSIYLQSVTPILRACEKSDLNNEMIRDFNKKLEAYAAQKGYPYLDIYGAVADSDGCLPPEYCVDPDLQGIHFTDAACEIWAKYLRENVKNISYNNFH